MRKNRRNNELFIGTEFLNIEGRDIKHPALIRYFANLNVNKTRDDLIQLKGMDIETNHETGEMKLLGIYEGDPETYEGQYSYYDADFLRHIVSHVKSCVKDKKHLAYWRSFDAFQILRIFILHNYSESRKVDALERYGKVSGEFNHKTLVWDVRPVISVEIGHFIIGIKQVIRDSIQFFIQSKTSHKVTTCWGYNIASLYLKGLEKEADASKGGRFEWYSKLEEEAHLIDWDRFYTDDVYRNLVLKSNKLDSRGAMALGYEVQKEFKSAFGVYPVSLISQGGHARSSITATIDNDITSLGMEGEVKAIKKLDELSSISIMRHLDNWLEAYPEPIVKDLDMMFTEAYSGGYIDAIRFGYTEKGWFADISSAYPSIIQKLYDLRDSTLQYGEGCPPDIEFSYIFIRGEVHIPFGVDYHPITIKHPVNQSSNIRPIGDFKATYTKDERDFVKSVGGTFTNEKWIAVVTKGKPSVLSHVTNRLLEIRDKLIAKNDRAEGRIKRIVNSLYGIQFEAVNIHEEVDGKPERVGYRAGEFWDPLYACIITSRTRIIEASACTEIAKNGGEPILLMTDSVIWKGNKSDLPDLLEFPWGSSGIKKKKTLGYYEVPDEVRNIICFGSGRYGFEKYNKTKDKWIRTNKRRGLNVVDIDDPDGIVLSSDFSWENVMKLALHNNSTNVDVKVRTLLSVGTIRKSKEYSIHDLGRIIEEIRDVDLVGNKKRLYNPDIFDIQKISKGLVKTESIYLSKNMYVDYGLVDGTLPKLREKVESLTMQSKKIRKRITTKKRQKRFYDNNKIDIKKKKAGKYRLCKDAGFNTSEAKRMMTWGYEAIENAIVERRKSDEIVKAINKE